MGLKLKHNYLNSYDDKMKVPMCLMQVKRELDFLLGMGLFESCKGSSHKNPKKFDGPAGDALKNVGRFLGNSYAASQVPYECIHLPSQSGCKCCGRLFHLL